MSFVFHSKLLRSIDKKAYGYDVCFTLDTLIPLLDGTTATIQELIGKSEFWVYSINDEGELRPGRGHSAHITLKNTPILSVELDNGQIVKCTYSHKFLLRNGSYCAAENLSPGTSLMPLYRDLKPIVEGNNDYERTYQPGTDSWIFTHRFVEARCPKGYVRHHKDLNRFNNTPDNLQLLRWDDDHVSLHQALGGSIVTEKAKTARRKNMLKLNASHKGQPGPELSFTKPWVDNGRYREYTASIDGKEHQKQANRVANHKRWHINRNRLELNCSLCFPINHKVVSITPSGFADVGDFSVDKYHNFALLAGVFVHNSGETFEGSGEIANRENQTNINDTAQPQDHHETPPNPLNIKDNEAEKEFPELQDKTRISWPPRIR